MHAILISMCEKKAIARTSKVLDAYGFKYGEGVWFSDITQDGLETLRHMVLKTATKSTAVACHIVKSGSGFELAWTVGNKRKFDTLGRVGSGYTEQFEKIKHLQLQEEYFDGEPVLENITGNLRRTPTTLKLTTLALQLSSLAHDIGKFGEYFQRKLRLSFEKKTRKHASATAGDEHQSAITLSDPIRHEWLSFHVMSKLLQLDPQIEITPEVFRNLWPRNASKGDDKALISMREFHYGASVDQQNTAGLVRSEENTGAFSPTSKGVDSIENVMLYAIFTHHHLPRASSQNGAQGDFDEAIYVDKARLDNPANWVAAFEPQQPLLTRLQDLMNEVRQEFREQTKSMSAHEIKIFCRAQAHLIRWCLVLSDAYTSSHDLSEDNSIPKSSRKSTELKQAFANTISDHSSGKRLLNQLLSWHLNKTSDLSSSILRDVLELAPPGISDKTRANILRPSEDARFAWQDEVSSALFKAHARSEEPTLVMNTAGTGSGKTRVNAKILASLNNNKPLRIACALNLRTLTLQTADAYRKELGMSDDELGCIIGCDLTLKLHQQDNQVAARAEILDQNGVTQEDEDGNFPEPEHEGLYNGFLDFTPPAWLQHNFKRTKNLESAVLSAALVSTTDFLESAGNPAGKTNQSLALLRASTSDLIVDEVDSYDPKALCAVANLVFAYAFFGRNVVVSSATLSLPVARAIYDSYNLGIQLGQSTGFIQGNSYRCAFVNDRTPAVLNNVPVVMNNGNDAGQAFSSWYTECMQTSLASLGKLYYRPAEILSLTSDIGLFDIEQTYGSIGAKAMQMHQRHKWEVLINGSTHKVSIGLVRCANIKHVIELARHLLENDPASESASVHTTIGAYHSGFVFMRRYLIERDLDQLLKRKDASKDGERFLANINTRKAIETSIARGKSETMFVLVSSPIEEVGRDHDFDWGIIEPSSTQSLAQVCGRINRHRLAIVTTPNVCILQFNFRYLEQQAEGRAKGYRKKNGMVFVNPGLETMIEVVNQYGEAEGSKSSHESYDMFKLLDPERIERNGQIDGRIRLDGYHPMARYDDRAIEYVLSKHRPAVLDCESNRWMNSASYTNTPLRDEKEEDVFIRLNSEYRKVVHQKIRHERHTRLDLWSPKNLIVVESFDEGRVWLYHSDDDIAQAARDRGVPQEKAFEGRVTRYRSDTERGSNYTLVDDVAFGHCLQRKNDSTK